jgi:hypothetical protein
VRALLEALSGTDAPAEALRRFLGFVVEATEADTGAIVLNEDESYTA